MFKTFQDDRRKPQAKTLADLIDRNFTFIGQFYVMECEEIWQMSDQQDLPR